ncbi:MAG: hypothetical protein ABIJ96_12205 [Elusimicrobiota bacterium]
MSKRICMVLWAIPILLALCGRAHALFTPAATASSGTVPSGLIYQGRLEDAGVPAAGLKNMVFRLYDTASGGTPLWDSGTQSVSVNGGVFGVVLDIPLGALAGKKQRYIELIIEGITLTPRDPLQSVPYAKIAQSVEGSIEITGGGFTLSNADGPILHVDSATAQVGIGTDTFSGAGIKLQTHGGDVVIGSPAMVGGTSDDDLFVEGNLSVDGQVSFQGASFADLGVATNTNTGELFKVGEGTFTVLTTGRVGIGTNNPGGTLDVDAGDVPGILLQHATRPQIKLQANHVDKLVLEHDGSVGRVNALTSDLVLETNSSEVMRLESGGNVGIGGAPGAFKLDVTGSVNISGGLTLGTDLPLGSGGTGASSAGAAQTNLDVPSRSGQNASGSWTINIVDVGGGTTGNAAKAAALSAAPATCLVSGQFAKGIQADGDAICVDVASEIPETGIEDIIYDNDNNLTTIGGPWGVEASGTNDINFDKTDNTFFIDVSQNYVGIGTNLPNDKLDVQGGDINTSGKIREGGNELVPAGMILFFNLASCPAGWTELAVASGRAIVGKVPAGTLLGVPPGIAPYTNLEDRAHTHDMQNHKHTVDPDNGTPHSHGPGTHTHSVDPGGNHNHTVADHNHSVDLGNHNHTGPNHQHGFDVPGSWSGGPSGNVNVGGGGTDVGSGSHGHWVDPGAGTSGWGGNGNTSNHNPDPVTSGDAGSGNTGDYNPGSVASGAPSANNTTTTDLAPVQSGNPSTNTTGSTSHTLPYIQLLVCEKT